MVYITGDTHGEIDAAKLNTKNFGEQRALSKNDFVIIAGDFGFVWHNNKTQEYWLKWLDDRRFTTLFVDGNHENFEQLNQYPVEIWNGGKIHRINNSIIHLMRGQIYSIDDKKIFTFGGGTSIDKAYRMNRVSWWEEEMPSAAEYQEGIINLEECNWTVDYIITHTGPSKIIQLLSNEFAGDNLSHYLQNISEKAHFQKWFFGHYHIDRTIENKFYALYHNITALL